MQNKTGGKMTTSYFKASDGFEYCKKNKHFVAGVEFQKNENKREIDFLRTHERLLKKENQILQERLDKLTEQF